MDGLQHKAAKNRADPEGSKTSFRKIVSVVLDEWIEGDSDSSDQGGHQATRMAKGQMLTL